MQSFRSLLRTLARHWQYALLLAIVTLISAVTVKSVLAATWTSPRGLPGSTQDFLPDAVIDETGMVHVLFLDYSGGENPLLYARGQIDATGTTVAWESIQRIGMLSKRDYVPIIVDPSGTIHALLIGTDNSLYYLTNPLRGQAGAWTALKVTTCNWSPDIARDAAGYLYVTCTYAHGDGTEAIFLYRDPNGAWGGPINASGAAQDLIRNNKIAVAGGFVHIFYDLKTDTDGPSPFLSIYSRGGIGGFNTYNFPSSFGKGNNGDATIVAADYYSGMLYAGFVHGDLDRFYFSFTASGDAGASWTPTTDLSKGYRWWYGTKSMHVYNNIASFVSEQSRWDGDGVTEVYIHYEDFNPAVGFSGLTQISQVKGTQPSVGASEWGKVIAWVLGNTEGVYYVTSPGDGPVPPTSTPVPTTPPQPTDTPIPTITPTPDQPAAFLQVGDGDMGKPIKGANTSVLITMSRGSADQYKIWNDGSGEPATYQPLSPPLEAPPGNSIKTLEWSLGDVGTNDGTAACVERTVRGKVSNSAAGTESNEMVAVARVDPGVDADVVARNPAEGDPGYTGTPAFVLDVQANVGECSGIKRIRVGQYAPGQSAATSLSETDLIEVTTNGPIPLLSQNPGTHQIEVVVDDTLGWSHTYQTQITLDTASPGVDATGGGMAIQDRQTDQDIAETGTTLVDLNFTSIQVTEETYQNNGKNFWGVCVANSLEALPIATTATLDNCTAVEVEQAQGQNNVYNFRVEGWELLRGLSTNPAPAAGSTVYVYACIMDGANCSDQVLSDEVVLSNGYVEGTRHVFLPLVTGAYLLPPYFYPR
jgi:hypothetical protein